MTLILPPLYHWSPTANRAKIKRHGLKPTCHTAVWVRPDEALRGHSTADLPEETILCVCFGTTPSTAWALSGYWSAEIGEEWDLWEVEIGPKDEIHHRPHMGTNLDEVRIANPVPADRCWLVGSRVRRRSRWHA